MWYLHAVPVLAAGGIDTFIWLAVILYTVLQGIFSLIKANKRQQPRAGGGQQPMRRAGDARLSDEIEKFLNKVREQQAGPAPQRQRPPAPKQQQPQVVFFEDNEPVDIEIVQQKKPPAAARRKRRPQKPQKPQAVPAKVEVLPSRMRPGDSIARRKAIVSDSLGEAIRAEVKENFKAGGLSEHMQERLNDRISQAIQAHLGALDKEAGFVEASETEKRKQLSPARKIVQLLRDPEGVRQAILINEILSPPLGSRRR